MSAHAIPKQGAGLSCSPKPMSRGLRLLWFKGPLPIPVLTPSWSLAPMYWLQYEAARRLMDRGCSRICFRIRITGGTSFGACEVRGAVLALVVRQ